MKIKTFILTFLMIMSGSILFGQNSANVATETNLLDAIKAGQFGEMNITLTENIEVAKTVEIPVGYTITIDLNGKTITAAGKVYAFNNLGNLTIKGAGSIEARGINNGANNPEGNAPVLNIEGGIFKNIASDGGAAIYNYAEAYITGGEFYGGYAAITNKGNMEISNAFIESQGFAAIVNMGGLTYGENVYIVGEFVDNFDGITGTVEGEAIACVARINKTAYANFATALSEAKAMTGDVTVEIYSAVEFANGMELSNSTCNYTSMTFVGMCEDAKMTVNQNAGGDYITAHGKTVAFENIALAKANPAWSGNAGHMGNYFSIQGGTATYNNCTFLNGACTSGGTATYNNCTFQNEKEFGLWVYDDALVTVNNSVVDSYKGIKVYSEGETSVTSTLKVENTTFTSKLERPAVAIGYAVSVELVGNTYNNTTDVIELDSGSDADCEGIVFVAQDAEGNDIASTLTAVDRSKNNARCGVLMDGKIYTSVTTAAQEAQVGDTVTLLFDTEEEVELPAGVALDYNNYTANNVTIDLAGALTRCHIDETESRTRIFGDIEGMLSVKESVVVELYSGETKLATTTLAKQEYLSNQNLTVNIVISGEASSSWNTEWHVAPIAHLIPNKAVLYLDGEKMNEAEVAFVKSNDYNYTYVWGALTGVKASPAMIGTTGYATFQEAINAAVDGDEIKLYETLEENVTVSQAPDVKITIDGNNNNYRGTITVDGGSAAYETAALTIKNFSFNAYSISKDAVINLGGTNPTRYTNHVTIENCDFRGNDANKNKVAVKSYTGGCKNLTITECTATGLHSLAQLYTTAGVKVEGCKITNSKSGISLTASSGVSISDVTMDVEKYGIRVDAGSEVTTKISDCDIKAYVPVIARNATGNYTFEFNGNNTMTPANPDGKFCVVDGGNNSYEDGDVNLEDLAAPTGFVMVTLNDANLSYEGVYGGHTHEAKIGDTRYVFLQNALDAVEASEEPTTIEIIRDVTSDATVSQVEGENIIIDGKGFNFSGTIYIEGNARYTDEETLTIQNFNFTTEKDSHDFISSNSTEPAKRYAHNVTVKDCNFTATAENNEVVGMRFRQSYNINVEGGEFTNLHSVMWATGISGATVKDIVATGCKEGGISFGTSTDLTVENAKIEVAENEKSNMANYGIRVDASVATTLTVKDSEINAFIPVVARSASANYTMNFEGENTMTEGNDHDKWCVIGGTEYKTGAELPNDATGNVIVNLNDEGLSYDGVHGNFAVAKIGNVQYSTFAAALEAAQNNATIELIYKEGDAPIAMNGALYGKNVTVTGTANVDWSKGWLFIGRGGEGDAQLTFNNANLTSASNNKKYGINVSGKAADGHAYDGTLRIEGHSNIEVDYIITRNRLVVVNASTLIAKNGFVLGGRPAEETVNGSDATASVFLTNNAHIIVNGNKTTIGYEGKATVTLSTGGTSFKCYNHDVTITEKGIVELDGATFNATKLVNNGTVNVKSNSSLDIATIEGNAININNATLADANIGGAANITNVTFANANISGAVNAFGTNNFTGETNVGGLFSVGYNNASAAPVVVNITGNFNGGNVLIGISNDHVLNLGDAEGERTTANFATQLGAFGDVNINNADVTYQYAFIRNDFNVTNSTMEIKGGYNTYFSGNAKVVVDNSTWKAGAYTNIGSYDSGYYGNADVTLKNGSSMTATNLNVTVGTDNEGNKYNVKVTLEDNSSLEATKLTNQGSITLNESTITATTLTNQGSIVLASEDAKVTSNEFANAPTTTVPYKKVGYVDGSYVVIDKDYVAQIIDAEGNASLDRRYETFAEAVEAALDGETIELIYNEGDNAIAMAADLHSKNITVKGTATVDWSKGFLFVGYNGTDATLTFQDANLTSASNNSTYGINVSGAKADGTRNNGTVIINNSTIELDYLMNRHSMTLKASTLTVKNGFSVYARSANEAVENAEATMILLNESKLVVDNLNGGLGIEGKGTIDIDATSEFNCLRDFTVSANGTLNIDGTVIIAEGKKLTNNGEVNINGGNVSVTSIVNNGTISVAGESELNTTVTGEGSINVNGATLAETTKLYAATNNVVFNGENNINGATIVANEATVVDGKLAVNEGADVKFTKLTVNNNKQLSISRGKLNVTYLTNDGITSINYAESTVNVSGTTTNNSVLNISNKAVYKTDIFVNNSENLNVSTNSKLEIRAARFATNSIAKIAGEVYAKDFVNQEENAVIRLTDAAAKFTTANAGLNIVTTVADSKVAYTDGAYVVVAKQYLAKIGDVQYESLQEAFDAAETGDVIELFNDNVSVIPMNASLYGKDVTITGTAVVNWHTNGEYWLYVGRGGEGDATLTFDNAYLTSVSDNGGIHVSGRENGTNNKYDGKVIIKDSNIELTEFVNRNVVEVINSTVTTSTVLSHGRPAKETGTGEDATATFTLTNSTLNAGLWIKNGGEGFGIMNVDAQSNVNGKVEVVAKGTLYSAGNITGEITKADAATIQLTGGIYTTEPQEGWCAENYGAFPYDETSWIVREVYGVQTIELAAGWNWVSTYIEQFGEEGGLAMLQNNLGENGYQIKNNFAYSTNFGGELGWFGELEETSELQMYMVNVYESQVLELEGDYVNYEAVDNAIELNHGWNWIAYSVSEEINISDALSNLEASTGDIIKTMGASAVYLNGMWVSSNLTSLKPGSGYMYHNKGEFTSFNYSSRVTKTSSESADNRANNHWTADIAQYPNNMTMIAMTDVEGGDYEVAAFVNGEVRGSVRPVYVEELNAYILVLTISGDNVEEITFKYYDITTGEEVEFSNRINYTNDAIIGSITEPYKLTRGTTGIGEAAMSEVNIYPNPTTTGIEISLNATCDTVEVFNALGVKVAEYQNVDSIDALETAGIYVIRITNDGNVQNCRLVVK